VNDLEAKFHTRAHQTKVRARRAADDYEQAKINLARTETPLAEAETRTGELESRLSQVSPRSVEGRTLANELAAAKQHLALMDLDWRCARGDVRERASVLRQANRLKDEVAAALRRFKSRRLR
jgi:hypothetical protein